MSQPDIAAGGRLRDRFGSRNPASVFAVLGVVLVGAGAAVPDFQTLLFAWGGTALFVALLLRFVVSGPTLSAAVASDVYAVMAGNARRLSGEDGGRYVPTADGTTLAVGDRALEPVGNRLLADTDLPGPDASVGETLSVVADVVVTDLELASELRATETDSGARVAVTGSRVGTGEVFDHPVASVFAVALARQAGAPVAVEAAVEGPRLVVTCRRSEAADELLERSHSDEAQKEEPAEDQW